MLHLNNFTTVHSISDDKIRVTFESIKYTLFLHVDIVTFIQHVFCDLLKMADGKEHFKTGSGATAAPAQYLFWRSCKDV